jgi:hypothetical protein
MYDLDEVDSPEDSAVDEIPEFMKPEAAEPPEDEPKDTEPKAAERRLWPFIIA